MSRLFLPFFHFYYSAVLAAPVCATGIHRNIDNNKQSCKAIAKNMHAGTILGAAKMACNDCKISVIRSSHMTSSWHDLLCGLNKQPTEEIRQLKTTPLSYQNGRIHSEVEGFLGYAFPPICLIGRCLACRSNEIDHDYTYMARPTMIWDSITNRDQYFCYQLTTYSQDRQASLIRWFKLVAWKVLGQSATNPVLSSTASLLQQKLSSV